MDDELKTKEQLLAELRELRGRLEPKTASGGPRDFNESEQRFRAIFEMSTVGKSLTAPDGKLLKVNRAFADMLGYDIEEMQRVNFAAVTHSDDVAESRECIRTLLAGEQEN